MRKDGPKIIPEKRNYLILTNSESVAREEIRLISNLNDQSIFQEKQNRVLTGTKMELGNLVAAVLAKLTKEDQGDELALLQVKIPKVILYIHTS